jgi:hypothetical protein
MSILLSLSPFAVFFALMRLVSPIAGLIGGFVVSVLLCAHARRRRESVKILEIGSAALFGLLVAYTLVGAPRWTVATVRLAVDSGLLAIVLVSLAIGRPFTLQYARERVPEQFWASPIFMAVNRAVSAVWGGAFAIMVAADVAAEFVPAIPLWVDVAASVAAFVGAVWFTRWYPAKVRRAVAAAFGPESTPA